MAKTIRDLQVRPNPSGDELQLTYETVTSRRLVSIPQQAQFGETAPHGAGSFHDPEHHAILMDRLEAYYRHQR